MTSTSRSVRLPPASSSSSSSSSTGRVLGCIYDPTSASLPQPPGQPRFSPIAHFVSAPNDGIGNDALSKSTPHALPSAGRLLAVNSSYVAYAVKKGLVRVIDRRTSAKTLLRGHGETTRIVDAAFFGADVDGQKKEGAAALWNAMRNVRCGRRGGNASSSSSSTSPPPPAAASDILATVGGMQDEACVLIWRIYVHPGNSPSEDSLAADKLIELRFPLAARILWHPFDPNRFLLLHRNEISLPPGGGHLGSVATLVETKCLVTTRHTKLGHMVCDCPPSTVPGATQFVVGGGVNDDDVDTPMMRAGVVNDASWSSRDARHVLTAHDDGMVRLWDVVLPPETVGKDKSFRCVGRLDVAAGHGDEARRVTRVIFLSQYETSVDSSKDGAGVVTPPFVTGTSMNHELTLWSGFGVSGGVSSSHTVPTNGNHPLSPPQRLYVFQLQSTTLPPTVPPSIESMINVELCPAPYRPADTVPSSLLLLSERSNARMHALHLDTQWKNNDDTSAVAVMGFDYVTTLDVVHPILSSCVAASSSSSTSFSDNGGTSSNCLEEEKDVDLGCVQTKAVQMLSLSAEMVCAPPPVKSVEGGESSNGVRVLHWTKDEEAKEEEKDKEEEQDNMEEIVDFEEEYDLEEDNTQAEVEYSTGDDDEDDNVPKEPSAPLLDNDAAAVDPFSNWLGAIVNPLPPPTVTSSNHATTTTMATAVTTTTVQPPPPPPGLDFMFPPPPPGLTPSAPVPPVKEEMAFLSPMQLLGKSTPDPVLSSNVSGKSRDESTSAKKSVTQSTKKKKGGGGGAGGSEHTTQKPLPPPPTAILQREEAKGDIRSSSHPSGSNLDIRSIENAVERIMATHVKSLESKVVDAVRKTVASEVQSAMEKAAERALRDAMFHQKLEKAAKDSAATAARDAVAAMQAPMVTAFHQTMKEIMIPAYEAATSQMFHQMSKTMDHGLAQIATSQAQSTSSTMEAMSQQMMKMSEAIQSLSLEVAQLRSAGVAAAAANNNNGGQTTTQKAPHPPPRPVDTRQEILSLCQARRYEEAFTKAVSAANGDVVLFTCKHADITAAFNGEVTLSQTILICLMQQLGAVLVSATDPTDFKIIVTWLQEIAVTIDPTNENIKRHVGSVVQQLLSNINSKMSNCDPAFRRPLQTLMQVIRGLL